MYYLTVLQIRKPVALAGSFTLGPPRPKRSVIRVVHFLKVLGKSPFPDLLASICGQFSSRGCAKEVHFACRLLLRLLLSSYRWPHSRAHGHLPPSSKSVTGSNPSCVSSFSVLSICSLSLLLHLSDSKEISVFKGLLDWTEWNWIIQANRHISSTVILIISAKPLLLSIIYSQALGIRSGYLWDVGVVVLSTTLFFI